jgi:DNA-binding CsgD family transcriptional regulator
MNDPRRIDNHLALTWHAGATRVPMEGFQAWALAALKRLLRFDRALWGLGAGVGPDGRAFINAVHLHRVDAQVMVDYEQVRHCDPLAHGTTTQPGRAVRVDLDDQRWQTPDYAPLRAHAARYELSHVVCVSAADDHSGATQFITLARSRQGDRFSELDALRFELLAPHAMQAYISCRTAGLADATSHGGRSRNWATAIIDRTGTVHDQDQGFGALLQREWPGWSDPRVPAPLADVAARHHGQAAEYLGQQLKAQFAPVHDLFLLALRPRIGTDMLTAREREVAQQYASGATYRQIAASLCLAPTTVRAHLRSVFAKLGVNNKTQVADKLRC